MRNSLSCLIHLHPRSKQRGKPARLIVIFTDEIQRIDAPSLCPTTEGAVPLAQRNVDLARHRSHIKLCPCLYLPKGRLDKDQSPSLIPNLFAVSGFISTQESQCMLT